MSENSGSLKSRFGQLYQKYRVPLPPKYFESKFECAVADQLIHGCLSVTKRLDSMPYSIDTLDWNVQFSAQSGTFLLYLQGLTPVVVLVDAYVMTGHLPYMELARKFVESWAAYEQDKEKSSVNRLCWYDHSASLRTATLIYLGGIAAEHDLWEDDFYYLLFRLLERHGAWLNSDEKYAENHNHGIMQDRALLYVGVFLGNREWIDHGMERLCRQAEWAFNSEGVHKENSSGYAVMVNTILQNIYKFLSQNGESPSQVIINAVQKSNEYLNWCTMPNGYLVQTGDTQRTLYGKAPSVSTDTSKFYPEAGMYFYRSKTLDDPKLSTWKVAKSGYVRTTHKHADDCSFVLYAKGHEVFSDGGVYGYAKDAFRAYFISAKAHNSLVVDDASYLPNMKNTENVGMCNCRSYPGYDHIRLFNRAYKGVELLRDFCSADDLTLIFDTLNSPKEHTYSQLFHLSEDMSLLSSNNHEAVLRLADSGYTVRILQHGSPTSLQVIHGNPAFPGYGLISPQTGQIDATTTLKFNFVGTSGVFATSITIEDGDGFVRLGERKEKADALCYDAQSQAFTLGSLTVPYRQDFPQN